MNHDQSCESMQVAAMAYRDGETGEISQHEVDAHLQQCESCCESLEQTVVESIGQFQRASHAIDVWPQLALKLQSKARAPHRPSRMLRWISIAAAACVVLVLILSRSWFSDEHSDEESIKWISVSPSPYSITGSLRKQVSREEYRRRFERFFKEFAPPQEIEPAELSQLHPFAIPDMEGPMGILYVNSQGQVKLGVRYPTAQRFTENLAAVATKVDKPRGHIIVDYGFIDHTGRLAIPGKYDYALPFSDGLAAVQVNRRYGFIDQTGKMVIEPQFETANSFTNGMARVEQEYEDVAFIDKNGKRLFIINRNDVGGRFSEGLLYVNLPGTEGIDSGRRRGYVNRKFEFEVRLGEDSSGYWPLRCFEFHEGLAAIEGIAGKSNQWSYISTDATVAIPGPFAGAYPFSEGLAAVNITLTSPPKCGYVNQDGEMVIEPQFLQAQPFHDGLAAVLIRDEGDEDKTVPNAKWGYIDKQGEIKIPPQFYHASMFSGDVALVQFNPWGRGLINQKGEHVWRVDEPTH